MQEGYKRSTAPGALTDCTIVYFARETGSDEGIGAPKQQLIACAQHESFPVIGSGQFAGLP